MPTYRNITSDELWVEHLQQSVKPDELIEVDTKDDRVWPDTVWQKVAKKSTTKGEE